MFTRGQVGLGSEVDHVSRDKSLKAELLGSSKGRPDCLRERSRGSGAPIPHIHSIYRPVERTAGASRVWGVPASWSGP